MLNVYIKTSDAWRWTEAVVWDTKSTCCTRCLCCICCTRCIMNRPSLLSSAKMRWLHRPDGFRRLLTTKGKGEWWDAFMLCQPGWELTIFHTHSFCRLTCYCGKCTSVIHGSPVSRDCSILYICPTSTIQIAPPCLLSLIEKLLGYTCCHLRTVYPLDHIFHKTDC